MPSVKITNTSHVCLYTHQHQNCITAMLIFTLTKVPAKLRDPVYCTVFSFSYLWLCNQPDNGYI